MPLIPRSVLSRVCQFWNVISNGPLYDTIVILMLKLYAETLVAVSIVLYIENNPIILSSVKSCFSSRSIFLLFFKYENYSINLRHVGKLKLKLNQNMFMWKKKKKIEIHKHASSWWMEWILLIILYEKKRFFYCFVIWFLFKMIIWFKIGWIWYLNSKYKQN